MQLLVRYDGRRDEASGALYTCIQTISDGRLERITSKVT